MYSFPSLKLILCNKCFNLLFGKKKRYLSLIMYVVFFYHFNCKGNFKYHRSHLYLHFLYFFNIHNYHRKDLAKEGLMWWFTQLAMKNTWWDVHVPYFQFILIKKSYDLSNVVNKYCIYTYMFFLGKRMNIIFYTVEYFITLWYTK